MERRSKKFGLAGTLVGFLALATGVVHFFAGPLEEAPPLEDSVAETAVSIKEAIRAKLGGEERPEPPPPEPEGTAPDRVLRLAVIGAGLLAFGLGVLAFVQSEPWRPAVMALALGGAAVAFQFFVFLAVALIAVLLITSVVNAAL